MKKRQQEQPQLTDCPVCLHGRFLNRLSKDGFFCSNCLNEFKISGKKTYILDINPNSGEFKILSK